MLRPVPRDPGESAEPGAGTAGSQHARTLLRPSWLRAALLGVVGIAIFGSIVLLAYQLALARVPQHRATLERLVRAQTGLHMRFNEVGLRWGWYGPEVVFRRVELGEPGRSNVLLRASELMVNFDAWRTLQSGQLQAGRITLIGPDIDLVRIGTRPAANEQATVVSEQPPWNRSRLLERWPRGRVDVEGGTLTLPAFAGSTDSVSLKIRRASLRRTDQSWSATANVFLPERLGRTARLWMRLTGDAPDAPLTGAVQIEGRRLVFNGWRELLRSGYSAGRFLPASGSGDVVARFTIEDGRLAAHNGSVRAGDVSFRPSGSQAARSDLVLGYLRGDWKARREDDDWRLNVEDLGFGLEADMPRTSLVLTIGNNGARFDGRLKAAPVETLLAIAGWAAPDLDLRDAALTGDARDITFDWLITRPMGEKLRLGAQLRDVRLSSPSLGMTFSRLQGELSGTETGLVADIEASEATLDLSRNEEVRLEDMQIATRLQLLRAEQGWELSTEQLSIEHQDAELLVGGALALQSTSAEPALDIRATVEGVDIPLLKSLLGAHAERLFGPLAQRLTAGRIEVGKFELKGTPQELPFGAGSRFSGSLRLREAGVAGDEQWPRIENLDAQLTWQGPRMQATVERGTGGPFELVSLNADWLAVGARAPHIVAQARGHLEEVTTWLAGHPTLLRYAEQAHMLPASGPALFTFEASPPVARSRSNKPQAARVRVAASLEDASFHLDHLPPVKALRGAVSFDDGRLQRSTLTASWLGGPVTLRLSEQQERGGTAPGFLVQAEGLLDAQELAAAIGIEKARQLSGRTDWTGTLSYAPAVDSQPSMWRVRANSALLGVESELPAPLAKPQGVAMPLRIEMQGVGTGAALRVAFGDSLRTAFELNAPGEGTWQVQRGALRFGEGAVALPGEQVVELAGTLDRVELPAWLAVWREIESGAGLLPLRADVSVRELVMAGRSYSDITLAAHRDEDGFELNVDGTGIKGVVRWPDAEGDKPAEARFAYLSIPERTQTGGMGAAIAAFGPTTDLLIDQLESRGRTLGTLSARIEARDGAIAVENFRLTDATHEANASAMCESEKTACVVSFELNSSDAAATLRDFGFREELTAGRATLSGQLQWPVESEQPWIEKVSGRVAMVITEGSTRAADKGDGRPLALLSVPALLHQSAVASAQIPMPSIPTTAAPALAFERLEAEFALRDGNAFTSNLHFDGDAEILMRGRIGLATRDYDQVAWVLRGEDRLPSAVRRFGATPRVAAAWLALRELVSGPDEDRSRAVLHLGGTWDTPVVERIPKATAGREDDRSE